MTVTALMTARAVADTLGVSAETVLRWTRRGEIPAIKLPSGAIRYRAAGLEEWLAERELTPTRNEARGGESADLVKLADAGGGHGEG